MRNKAIGGEKYPIQISIKYTLYFLHTHTHTEDYFKRACQNVLNRQHQQQSNLLKIMFKINLCFVSNP